MDESYVIDVVNEYADLVVKEFSPKNIYLYGSYSKGKATVNSDIDIAIVFDEYNESILKGLAKLYFLKRNIDIRIEPIILEEKNDYTGFLSEVKKTGILIK